MRVIPLLFIPGILSVKNSFNARKILGRLPFALLIKDLKIFLRDNSQWPQLLLLLALAGFVLAAVAARFIFPSISLEGRALGPWDILQSGISFIIVIVINSACFFIPLKIGLKSMETEKWM